jgi:ankyrin repeat protein
MSHSTKEENKSDAKSAASAAAPEPTPAIDYKAAMERLLTPELLKASIGSHRETPLMHAARDGHADLVRILAPKSDLLATGGVGEDKTALNMAAAGGHAECVKILLERQPREQCEIAAWKYDSRRPFDSAVAGGHWDCAVLLAPFTEINKWSNSASRSRPKPIPEAARQGRLDMLRHFVEQVELDETPDKGWGSDKNWLELALEAAAESKTVGAHECLAWIVQRPDVKVVPARDKDGREEGGALFKAIFADNAKAAMFLLPWFGAETSRVAQVWVDEKSESVGGDPLSVAIEKAAEKTVEALLPLCDKTLSRVDTWANAGVSKALIQALEIAGSLETWHKGQTEKIARAWRIVDAVGARWALIGGPKGQVKAVGSKLDWLTRSEIADPRWERFPRWRASIEARALSDAIAAGAAPAPEEAKRAGASETKAPSCAEAKEANVQERGRAAKPRL